MGFGAPERIQVALARKNLPLAVLVALAMFGTILFVVVGDDQFGIDNFAPPARHAADYSNISELGQVIYTEYVYSFEIAAVILLVGIIAAISLTLRRRPNTRHQKVEEQVAVKSEDRLRVVKLASQPRKGKEPLARKEPLAGKEERK